MAKVLTRARGPLAGRRRGPHHAGRKARERARRHADVLATARRLFAGKGYQRTTMAEIAAAAELAIGTLYQLFPSKEAILRGLLEQQVGLLLARLRAAAALTPDPRRRLESLVDTQLGFFHENADFLRLYLSGWSGYDFTIRQDFGERVDAKYREYLELLAAVFRQGTRQGGFARRSPRRLAVALAGMLNALVRRWMEEPTLDLRAEGRELLDVFLHGAAGPGAARARRR